MEKETGNIIIGLCGSSGSGKTFLSECFARQGAFVIDTDEVYHSLVGSSSVRSACIAELSSFFGEEVINSDNSLNRKALGGIVFGKGNEDKLARLNEITHKYIREETLRLIKEHSEKSVSPVIIDAPLLYESGFDSLCDAVIVAYAPRNVAIRRIMVRDGISEKEAEARLDSQVPSEELIARADFAVNTHDSEENLTVKAKEILEDLKGKT